MNIDSGISDARRRNNNGQTRVQMWFRAPKIWDDFLEEKATREYCTKSELLRHAFKLAYGPELKEFRLKPGSRAGGNHNHSSTNKEGKSTETSSPPAYIFPLVPYETDTDPWVESMVAFVANKHSPRTHRVYRLVLNQFFTFAAKHPRDVKQSDVIRYRHHLGHIDRASSTIRQHLAAISGYYAFCISRDLTIYNPVTGVNRPSVNAYTSATWLNSTQAKALLSQPNRHTVKGKRDYAILLILLLTGLRRSELVNINRGDIRERGEKIYLTYTCKGGTKIMREIPRRCWAAVSDYLTASSREITDDSPLFVATTDSGERLRHYYGKNGHNGHHPLTPEALRQMVIHYSRCAFGEEVKVSPHTLRHTAGTLLRKSGRQIEEVQHFLKHKKIDTTRRYLHVVEGDDAELGECIARMLDL